MQTFLFNPKTASLNKLFFNPQGVTHVKRHHCNLGFTLQGSKASRMTGTFSYTPATHTEACCEDQVSTTSDLFKCLNYQGNTISVCTDGHKSCFFF